MFLVLVTNVGPNFYCFHLKFIWPKYIYLYINIKFFALYQSLFTCCDFFILNCNIQGLYANHNIYQWKGYSYRCSYKHYYS